MDWYLDAGDPFAVQELRHAFVDHLRLHAEPDSDIAAAELAFAEILANVHRHALGPAWVRLDWGDERSVLTVYDSGHSFEPDIKLPDDPFSAGGRGLFVAEQLTGEVRVADDPIGGVSVSVTLPVHGFSEPASDEPAADWARNAEAAVE